MCFVSCSPFFAVVIVEQLSIEHCAPSTFLELNENLDSLIVAVFGFRYDISALFKQPQSHRSRTDTLCSTIVNADRRQKWWSMGLFEQVNRHPTLSFMLIAEVQRS